MSNLADFTTMSAQQRADIVNQRQNIAISVPKSVLKLGDMSKISPSPIMASHIELPPSPLVLDDASTAQIFVHSPDGLEGAWQRLYIMTYNKGGHIFYREIDSNTVEAVFRF